MFNQITEAIKSANTLYTDVQPLAAIWLEKGLKTPTGKLIRVAPGALVKVQDGKLIDFDSEPTHRVNKCFGTLRSNFSLVLIDLNSGDELTIKL